MTATQLVARDDVRVFHATWAQLLEALPRREDGAVTDSVIVDFPYSERTHQGHDDGAASANRVRHWATVSNPGARLARAKLKEAEREGSSRRALDYPPWTPEDVEAFCSAWAPATRGWLVSITDHVLAPAWEASLERAGRYVFAPIACTEPGSRVRLVGDGPSNWSTWAVVSRPSDGAWLEAWRAARKALGLGCSLPGAYVVPHGQGDTRSGRRGDDVRVVGAKPAWLMERLVEDYSLPGEIVTDTGCGGGTTLLAALRLGRRAIGGDALLEHAQMSARRVDGMIQRDLFARPEPTRAEQIALFAEVGS